MDGFLPLIRLYLLNNSTLEERKEERAAKREEKPTND